LKRRAKLTIERLDNNLYFYKSLLEKQKSDMSYFLININKSKEHNKIDFLCTYFNKIIDGKCYDLNQAKYNQITKVKS
jgi:hypothetical protein